MDHWARHLVRFSACLMLLIPDTVLALEPATTFDDSDSHYSSSSQTNILRNEDLLVAIDRQNSDRSHFYNTLLRTRDLGIHDQQDIDVMHPDCLLKRAGDGHTPKHVSNIFHTRIGRLFALKRDVSVSLVPAVPTPADGCPGLLALIVQDYVDPNNNTRTVVENSGPLWTQLILADFNQDGFDDVLQFHSSTPLSGGFAFHTAVDVNDPRKGLRRVTFRGVYPEFMPVTGNPVSGDFNADGAIDVMWLGGLAKNNAELSIYRLSVCPHAGMTISGVTCSKPFQLIPGDTRDFSKHAIHTGNTLIWPNQECSNCAASTFRYDLAAGNFDGKQPLAGSRVRDELVFVRSSVAEPPVFEMLVYRFDNNLKPETPRVFDFSSSVHTSQQFVLASGTINMFGTADHIALLNYGLEHVQLNVIEFDSALNPHIRSMDVRKFGFFNNPVSAGGEPTPQGITIGRFDAPNGTASDADFNTQIAALYDVEDSITGERRTVVQIYTIGSLRTDRPQLRSEHIVANAVFDNGILVEYAPIHSGDLQGRSLSPGTPNKLGIVNEVQSSLMLGSPVNHGVHLQDVELTDTSIASGQSTTVQVVLRTGQFSKRTMQFLIVSTSAANGNNEVLDYVLIPHLVAGQEYQIRAPITPSQCGPQAITVIARTGEAGDQHLQRSSANIQVHCR